MVNGYKLCDTCGATTRSSLFVQTGWGSDPTDGKRTEEGKHLDLCQEHATEAAAFLLNWTVNATPQERVDAFSAGRALISTFRKYGATCEK